ncbi:unnamed protein product [Candida verbasci]|uniref:Acyl-CoA thioesterase II n=1 Tax=Candida verbasci TaxID=1227364 RepID=A0A9W4TTS4_9ASCO|nr:unnamed protein product [Candida verbasci]
MTISNSTRSIETIDAKEDFELIKIDESSYKGKYPLKKPTAKHRGVYGGNLVGQGLLVAILSSPNSIPHSLHSYFVRPVNDESEITWKIEKISNGRNYSNRLIKGYQNGKMVYVLNASLTKPKSSSSFEYHEEQDQQFSDQSKAKYWQKNNKIRIETKRFEANTNKDSFNWLMRYGIQNEQKITGIDETFKYVILSILTDWKNLQMILKENENVNNGANEYFLTNPKFNVSMDHSIYFHDDDFDPTDWLNFQAKCTRISHDRALIIAEIYNINGKHVATIIQERLYVIDEEAMKAKL